MSDEYKLTDATGRTVAIGTRDQMTSTLKHTVAGGEYATTGPGIDMRLHRAAGVVYPAGGVVDGEVVPTRNLDGCIRVFGATS